MKKYMKLFTMMMLLLSIAVFTACGNSEETPLAETTGETSDILVLGTSADYAPFEFMYPDEEGQLVYGGIDIYTAEYIAEDMGKTLQIENMSFDNLLTALGKGDFDIVLADIEATEDRKQAADFSDPYYIEMGPMLLVKTEKASQIKTYEDLTGKTLGAQTGTTKLNIISEIPEANVVALQSVLDLVNEVSYDKVDGILVDASVAQQYEATNEEFTAISFDEFGGMAGASVAVAKGDPKGLLPQINASIAKMNEENKMEEFMETAKSYANVWQEVAGE